MNSLSRRSVWRARPCVGTRRVRCAATAGAAPPALPSVLPLFPLQPVGVLTPGMTKTLHLYEAHFISMIEEATANKSNLLATAVLEPYMGEEGQSVPGSLVGGHNFSLSCACLCTVLQAKPYHGGYLVRLRGEARMGLSSLEQVEPYMRCAIYPMPDEPVQLHEMDTLRTKLAVLEDIMRDIQNLASKFRCDETAQIQQAMRWVNLPAIFPSVLSIEGQAAMPDSIATPSTSGTREEDEEENIVDVAARLSLASLQWLPHSGQLEKVSVLRGRLLAASNYNILERLDIAATVMAEQRNSLAAKCALIAAG